MFKIAGIFSRRALPGTGLCGQAFPRARSRSGMTLVEIMVAMSIMTIGVLGMVGAFKFFNVGIQSAKIRSLANNIAQERIEYLKNRSYYKVLVTTQTPVPEDTDFPSGEMIYDVAPNGQETVNVGGINFIRRVLIRKMNEDAAGNLQPLAWDQSDTGLKEIKVMVVWYERGEWRKLEVRNLRENPERVNKDCNISGNVKHGLVNLADATVRAQESPTYYGVSDSDGNYSFSIVPGTYTLQATKDGYFPSVLSSFGLAAGANATGKNFSLTDMYSGTISGYAIINNGDHLMISNVAGGTETVTGHTEWVEVYNPTTWTWTMANGLGINQEKVVFRYKETSVVEKSLSFNYRTTTLDPGHYYLFANTGTVTAAGATREADAIYSWNGAWSDQDDTIQDSHDNAGYVLLKDGSRTLDTLGWTAYAQAWPLYSPEAYEYFGVYWYDEYPWPYPINEEGMQLDMAFTRNSWFSTLDTSLASCFDSNRNYADFHISSSPIRVGPRSTADSQVCEGGNAAQGAVVFANDGVSSPVIAGSDGYFWITNVSTGSWTVYMSSGVVYSSVAYYGGTTDGYWSWAGYNALSTPTTFGYVTGRVTNILGAALSGIKIFSPSGTGQVATDWNGMYTLPVDAGVVTAIANYQSQDTNYVELSSMDVHVGLGEVARNVNFSLYQGGRIYGRVTTNGVDPLPGIPVVGFKGGVEQGSGISDGDGYFTISGSGISTGTYVVEPQLEAGEGSTPPSATVLVEAGLTAVVPTFTVSGAFGYISGTVSNSAGRITTGVLIYVTTSTLAANAPPPDISPGLRSGTGVYYAASSTALGNYNIPAKGGYSYNIYAWYTTWSGTNPTTVRREYTGVAVTPSETVTRTFSW